MKSERFKNLIIGIDETTDVKQLLDIGIRQFYFGYIPKEFLEKYNSKLSLNRRNHTKEQFLDLDKLFDIIDLIKKTDGIIYLTLNHITQNQTMLEFSKIVFELFKDKVDGIIVSNISIATFLKNNRYEKIVISNLFGTYSKQSVEFLIKQFNPIKIILPRDMLIGTIKDIVTSFQDMSFECFLFGDGCRFSESFCFIDQGDYSLKDQTLCSFAIQNNKIVKKANPAFKMVIKDTTLTDDEKKELLSTQYLDIESLIDKLFILYDEFDSKEISKVLHTLERLDIDEFFKTKLIYAKAKQILKLLNDFGVADNILQKISDFKLKNKNINNLNDNYKIYHRTNIYSINKTLEIFLQYENIVSYKIPSRGRNILNMLSLLNQKDANGIYNYKESMYKL